MTSTEDEDNGNGRPNAYFARIREEQEAEERAPTFTGAFRGTRPTPHGGVATVRPADTLGTEEFCWCGQPFGHSWPGKTVGAKHPKIGEGMPTANHEVDRRDLRAYHRRLQDFVLQCINTDGLKYRFNKNGVILYPPDASTPMTVSARNTDRQIRPLQKWYLEHVYQEPQETGQADAAAIQRLAEATNDPTEHPAKAIEYQEEPAKPEEYMPPVPEVVEPEPVEPEAASTSEWKPLIKTDGEPSEHFVTDGRVFRCQVCYDAGTIYETEHSKSTGGHVRAVHGDRGMWTPEARAKAAETSRTLRQRQTLTVQALELLVEATGYEVDTKRIAELQEDLGYTRDRLAAAERRADEAEAKHDELAAKLSLIREATGL